MGACHASHLVPACYSTTSEKTATLLKERRNPKKSEIEIDHDGYTSQRGQNPKKSEIEREITRERKRD
jgi:hypothetical protein